MMIAIVIILFFIGGKPLSLGCQEPFLQWIHDGGNSFDTNHYVDQILYCIAATLTLTPAAVPVESPVPGYSKVCA